MKYQLKRGIAVAVLVAALPALAAGCRSIDEPITEKAKSPVSAEAVQATLPVGVLGKAVKVPDWLPDRAGTFATAYKGPVWFPGELPSGFSVQSLDVVQMDANTGLVCDTTLLKGDKAVTFAQGSAKERTYDIVSVGKTAWGKTQADVVHENPADTSSRKMIVLKQGDSIAELSGDVGFEQLQAIAASMEAVKR